MPIKSLKGLLGSLMCAATLAVLSTLSGCATPCDAPGGLCAPIQANTSAGHPRATELAAPAAAPLPIPMAKPAPAEVQTMPVEDPNAAVQGQAGATAPAPAQAIRVALLLPLRSEALGAPADALRAGFMAAYERDRTGFVVNLIETGDSAQETVDAYRAALAQNDIVVGPLARSAVGALAASGAVAKPTIALNHPDLRAAGADAALPAKMLVMGLSIEDEARQVAQWAASDHPGARALIVTGANAWQRRLATAFAAHWKQLGNQVETAELADSNGYLSESGLSALRNRVDAESPDLLFAALDAGQARQLRGALGIEVALYGTSSVNPGTGPGTGEPQLEMDGVHVLDMPWQLQPDHPAVMVYPRWEGPRRTLDLDRLYALGIDAFRVAREIGLEPSTSFEMDGVTGRLRVSFGKGAARFERIQPTAVYLGGAFKLVGKPR